MNITKRENEIIANELRAFNNNFIEVKIIKYNRHYFIYQKNSAEIYDNTNYIYNTNNINVVKGWLYGCVQAKHKRLKEI